MRLLADISIARRRFLKRIHFVLGLGMFAGIGRAVGEEKKDEPDATDFKIPGGKAIRTLREAARQAGVEFILPAEMVRGIETRAIEGRYTPLDAFNRMLDGTRLVAFRHRKSGIYGIRKVPRPLKAKGAT